MPENIIEVKNLQHSYEDFKAVDGISFSVEKGEIFSFLGPNGAGKSTVINILITLLNLQKGRVTIAGHDLRTDRKGVREAIGIVFQENTLDRDMTVREILEFHGRLYSMPKTERYNRIEELMTLVQLDEKQDTLTRHLSGGMKRRLEIARGLMTRPEVLFLDEPTIGLDPQTRIRMWEYLRQVNNEGTTIFLTTHYMDEADSLSDRIGIIDHGQIITTGTPWDLKNTIGKDVIYLETDNNQKTSELLGTMGNVNKVTPKGSGLRVMVKNDGTHVLPLIIDRIRKESIAVKTINLKKPSMDDVFVHFTGKDIREEKAPKFPSHRSRR